MNFKSKHVLYSYLSFWFFLLFPQLVYARFYCVKKGDTLSTIALEKIGEPVYGKDGYLKKILELNPEIANQDMVYTNQAIFLVDKNNCLINLKEPVTEKRTDEDMMPDLVKSKVYDLGLFLGVKFFSSRFSSAVSDSSVDLNSSLSPSLSARFCWDQKSCLNSTLTYLNYSRPAGISLSKNNQIIGRLLLENRLWDSSIGQISALAGMYRHAQLKQISTSGLEVVTPTMGVLGASYGTQSFHDFRFELDLLFTTSSSENDVQFEAGNILGIKIVKDFVRYPHLGILFDFERVTQDASSFNMESNNYGLHLSYRVP